MSAPKSKDKRHDKFGRVLKGRKIDYSATLEYYKDFYELPDFSEKIAKLKTGKLYRKLRKPANKAAFIKQRHANMRIKAIKSFSRYFHGNTKANKKPVDIKNPTIAQLAYKLGGGNIPKGSKITFLPKSLAGKTFKAKDGKIFYKEKRSKTTLYYLSVFAKSWLLKIDELINDSEDEAAYMAIETRINKFFSKTPKGFYKLLLSTGYFSNGAEYSKAKIIGKVSDLIMAFIKSKGIDLIQEFFVAVTLTQKTGRKKRKKKRKR